MASFEIIGSRRLGLDKCEFDVALVSGSIVVGELFAINENGSLWEYVILGTRPAGATATLDCATWLPEDGAFVGTVTHTRAMNAADRQRWAKMLP